MTDGCPRISVVIPTFNERDNIARLLARLSSALESIPAEVIFVDDSDDGTEAEILRHDTQLHVQVIHRAPQHRRGGLSTAVLNGIAAARGEFICIMDGDLQHPPETIPHLLQRADATDADVVIASRNVGGGTNVGLDGRWRRFISWSFGLVTRVLFYEKLRSIKDPLSGFLLVRRSALKGIELRPIGYKISLEILIRAAGSHVEEVPYPFTARESGTSKAVAGTGVAFFHHSGLLLLEVPEVGRFWKFATVGAIGVVIYMGMLWLLSSVAGVHYGIAWAIAAEAAVLSNFTLNRNVTWFERRAESGGLLGEMLKYHAASALSVAANGIAFLLLARAGLGILLAGSISVWVGVATSFLGAERFVFITRRSVPLRRNFAQKTAEPSAALEDALPGDAPLAMTVTSDKR